MKKKMLKRSALILIAILCVSQIAACGGKSTNTNASTTTNTTNNVDGDKADQPIKFSFFSSDPNPNWNNMQDDVGKAITAKTGVTLDAEFAVGDPEQKVALIAASGKYPDLISAKNDISKLVDADAMLDLTDLIEEHAPNLKKVYGDYMKRLKYSNEDQAIYVIPSYDAMDQTYIKAGGGFELQHAVVKELGYPRIRTVQDFEDAIKQYKDKYPTIDGKPTIGLSLNGDDWHTYISVTNPAFYATGAPDDGEYYIDPKTYEATYHFRRPEEKEYFRWLNHMNDINLLDKESFVQKHDQYNAKIASGRVLGLIDQDWDYGDGENALKAAGMFERTYGHYPVTISEEYLDHSYQRAGFLAGYGVGISVDCADPVRAIKFLDFLASEEGQILSNWGVEGKQYNVVDGKRVIPEDVNNQKNNDAASFQKQTGVGTYTLMSAHYGDGVLDSTGNFYTTNFPEQLFSSYSEAEKATLDAYKIEKWKDLFPNEKDFEVKPWGVAYNITLSGEDEVTILFNKMKDITWRSIPGIILAKPDQFDKLWDDYMKELDKAGVEKMEKGFTEHIKERIELWK